MILFKASNCDVSSNGSRHYVFRVVKKEEDNYEHDIMIEFTVNRALNKLLGYAMLAGQYDPKAKKAYEQDRAMYSKDHLVKLLLKADDPYYSNFIKNHF